MISAWKGKVAMQMKTMALALALVLPFGTGAVDAASEEITIVGTGDGMSVLASVGDAFSKANPGVVVTVPDSIGSGGGIKSVGKGKYKVGRVARRIKNKEKHYGLVYRPYAKVPVVFFVNKRVRVRNLSARQVADIYSGKIKNWREVGGGNLPIRVVRREDGDSSLKVLRKTFPGFKDVVITPKSKEALTTPENFASVSNKAGTIGFGPYSGAMAANVKVLKVDRKSATDPGYPSTGIMALIFKEGSNKGNVGKFINFATSAAARAAIERAHGIPAPAY